jgi:hypothetical protein
MKKQKMSKTEEWQTALEMMKNIGLEMNKLFDLLMDLNMPRSAEKVLDMAEKFGHLCYDIRHSYPNDLREE